MMSLSLPPSVKIYFASHPVDMRNGIDGLHALAKKTVKDPFSGHLFVFVGKSKDRIKILYWDKNGFVLYLKRLEQGRFQLPVITKDSSHIELESTELMMLLDGIDLNARRLARFVPRMEQANL